MDFWRPRNDIKYIDMSLFIQSIPVRNGFNLWLDASFIELKLKAT